MDEIELDNEVLDCLPITDPRILKHVRGGSIAGGYQIKSFVKNWETAKEPLDLELDEDKISKHAKMFTDTGILFGAADNTHPITRSVLKEQYGVDPMFVWAVRSWLLEQTGGGVQTPTKRAPENVVSIGGEGGVTAPGAKNRK